jgi:hypothetical protein
MAGLPRFLSSINNGALLFAEKIRFEGGTTMKTWANILLGTWLVVSGLVFLGGVHFSASGTILSVLGIVAGILFLLADRGENLWPRLGNILLGAWLIAGGLLPLLRVRFEGSGVLLAVLGTAAGVIILLRR